ncbi:MAG TPA: L-threonylcarbamoyladenylate synthase [Gemmatimonadota bacterium]|nr:L-threonylcarbamoyladenylate synthase [Gemmatimonadota bacterium]
MTLPGGAFELRLADAAGIAAAVDALSAGRLVLHPTETVASLSGDPHNAAAVEAARRLKGYSEVRPFVCLVFDLPVARALAADWPAAAAALADAFWPGPLTLLLRAGTAAPAPVTEGGRLALRPAADPVSRSLLAKWGGPLFSTSANRRGQPPPTQVARAARVLAGAAGFEAVALALTAGASGAGGEPAGRVDRTALPSTIVDVTTPVPRVVRRGAIPIRRLREVWAEVEE